MAKSLQIFRINFVKQPGTVKNRDNAHSPESSSLPDNNLPASESQQPNQKRGDQPPSQLANGNFKKRPNPVEEEKQPLLSRKKASNSKSTAALTVEQRLQISQ